MLPRASDALLELIRAHDTAGVDAMLDADPVQRTHGGPGGEKDFNQFLTIPTLAGITQNRILAVIGS